MKLVILGIKTRASSNPIEIKYGSNFNALSKISSPNKVATRAIEKSLTTVNPNMKQPRPRITSNVISRY